MNEATMIRLVEMTNFLLAIADGEGSREQMVQRARKLVKELGIKYKLSDPPKEKD